MSSAPALNDNNAGMRVQHTRLAASTWVRKMNDDSDDKPKKMIPLNAIVEVETSEVEEVRLAIDEILPALWPGVEYDAGDLCGPEIWDVRYPARHTVIGMIVSYCVRHELLPLVCTVCKHEYPRRYRLK